MNLWLLAFVITFATLDRGVGGMLKRSIAYGILAGCSLLWGLSLGLPAAILAIGWGIYRSLPFKGGAGCPRPNQRLSALLRHIVALPVFALTAAFRQQDGDIKGILTAGVAYCLIATAIAVGYGLARDKREAAGRGVGSINSYVEFLRGAAYGGAAWVALIA